MSNRMGNEMILELAALLNTGMNKTAAKKDDDKDDKKDKKDDKKDKECKKCKCDPCECDKKKKEDKKDKDDKKKEAVMSVLVGLSKLAADLDEVGADEASSLVDEALHVIVQNLADEKKKVTAELGDDYSDQSFDVEPDYESVALESQQDIDVEEEDSLGMYNDWEAVIDKIGPENLEAFREYLDKREQ